MKHLKLVELLCSRVCHDLITPVGAVINSFELLEPNLKNLDPELTHLMQKSAQNAVQRLMMFRAGYSYGGHNLVGTFDKTKQLLEPYLESQKIHLNWPDGEIGAAVLSQDQPLWGRVVVNLAALLTESAPQGGDLSFTFHQEKNVFACRLMLRGTLCELKQDHILAMTGQMSEESVTPHSIQSYLTFLHMAKIPLTFHMIENSRHTIHVEVRCVKDQLGTSGLLF